jgi:aldehyde dehydrogenase (NAD+)/aldehyde dehydrogenase
MVKFLLKLLVQPQEDIDLVLDAAHEASVLEYNFSDRTQQYVVENCASNGRQFRVLSNFRTIDNGSKQSVNRAADIPYCIDHFRYFAGVIRADEASLSVTKHIKHRFTRAY